MSVPGVPSHDRTAQVPTRRDGLDGPEPLAGSAGLKQSAGPSRRERSRKAVLLRLDPAIYDALAKWAADDLRSVNGQLDHLLREALRVTDRMPRRARPPRGPGRPSSG